MWIVMHIVHVYAPMWFAIRGHPSCCDCYDGARHLWNIRNSVSLIFSNCEFEELRPYKTTDLVRNHGKSVVELFSTPPARARGGV